MQDPVFIVRALKDLPEIWEPLVEATTRNGTTALGGRPRMAGSWAAVYIVMTVLGAIDLEKFYNQHRSSPLWAECGFDTVPAFGTFYERITELECGQWQTGVDHEPARTGRQRPPAGEIVDDATDNDGPPVREAHPELGAWRFFEDAARQLIRVAREQDPRVGSAWHADGTAYHSQARLIHCCPDPDECLRRRTQPDGTVRRLPKVVQRAADELVKEMHHREDAGPEPEPGQAPEGALTELSPEDTWGELAERDPDHKYVWISGHLYRTRDTTAGLRMYGGNGRKKRVWVGGDELITVDTFTGGVLGFSCLSADINEHEGWPRLMERTRGNVGCWPGVVAADRGQGIVSVLEYNTRRGIHSAIPWRKDGLGRLARDFECARFDRHGIPHCQVCGGRGTIVGRDLGFRKDNGRGEPIIRFRCAGLWGGDACDRAGVQHVDCSESWKLLLPLSREHHLHHVMRRAHGNAAEAPFHHWRQRYEAMGKTYSTRPKRRLSRHCQELRTASAMLVDWLRICLRHGWVGDHPVRNAHRAYERDPGNRLDKVLDARDRYGLDLPYGPAAVAAGVRQTDDLPPKKLTRAQRASTARSTGPPGDDDAIPF